MLIVILYEKEIALLKTKLLAIFRNFYLQMKTGMIISDVSVLNSSVSRGDYG